jgi:membrane protein implicated in regulation of membrane protease activity
MTARTEEAPPATDQADPAEQVMPGTPPGLQASLVLAMDSLLTFIKLFKAETSLALSVLPAYVLLNLARLPIYFLTWVSFAAVVATAVYTLTGNLLLTAGSFFILQLGLIFVLESLVRKAREICSLPETRKSMAVTVASIKERFKDEQSHP